MIAKCVFSILTTAIIILAQDRWYPIRFEYSYFGQDEVGVSSGIWWSLHRDILPLDAYGPTFALKVLRDHSAVIPGVQLGFEANALIFCARMQCSVYKTHDNTALTLLSPQIGVTWISLVNLYVGYNCQISGPNAAEMRDCSLSFCVNLPSYFFSSL